MDNFFAIGVLRWGFLLNRFRYPCDMICSIKGHQNRLSYHIDSIHSMADFGCRFQWVNRNCQHQIHCDGDRLPNQVMVFCTYVLDFHLNQTFQCRLENHLLFSFVAQARQSFSKHHCHFVVVYSFGHDWTLAIWLAVWKTIKICRSIAECGPIYYLLHVPLF